MSNSDSKTITTGTEGSYSIGSDRHPVEVIEVRGASIVCREMSRLIVEPDGLGNGASLFASNPDGRVVTFTRRRNGQYRVKGWNRSGLLTLGRADAHRDPCF